MVKLAANLSMLFNEVDFLDRFAAAHKAGFDAVEYLFPYAYEKKDLAARLEDNGLKQVLFNIFPGNWDKGERGIAALPGREDEFRKAVDQALGYAQALKCPRIHVMSGIVPAGVSMERCEAVEVENLRFATKAAASAGSAMCARKDRPDRCRWPSTMRLVRFEPGRSSDPALERSRQA